MPTISYGDAVGNDALAIKKVISEMGYQTGIYAENIDARVKDSDVYQISQLPELKDEDIIIFNHSTGTDLCDSLPKLKGRKMMIYHNITPPHFFSGYSAPAKSLTLKGYDGTSRLSSEISYVMADSEYNLSDLRKMGYQCPMTVRPILIPFDDYKAQPDENIINKYGGDDCVNIVFVGRIAPNKKQEDIIAAFAYYKKYVNPNSRLILVGSYGGMEKYYDCLKHYSDIIAPNDVIYTGHIPFSQILAYYHIADVFLCMSEHEGFCVPLVEAMYFNVPIIAYSSSAIPDTLGGCGILTDDKDPVLTALLIDRVIKDKKLREEIISGQSERLRDFEYSKIRRCFVEQLQAFIDRNI